MPASWRRTLVNARTVAVVLDAVPIGDLRIRPSACAAQTQPVAIRKPAAAAAAAAYAASAGFDDDAVVADDRSRWRTPRRARAAVRGGRRSAPTGPRRRAGMPPRDGGSAPRPSSCRRASAQQRPRSRSRVREDRPTGQIVSACATLVAPLTTDGGMIGALLVSRRTAGDWPDAAQRLLAGAAIESSAALSRAYSHRQAEARASTDALTGLPNRRYFDEFCALLARRRRAEDAVGV